MSDQHESLRLRRLAIVVRAEREIAAETRRQYAKLLEAIAADVLHGNAPVVAAVDPGQNRNQINALWSTLTDAIMTKVLKLFKTRFLGTGADETRLSSMAQRFSDTVTRRLEGVPNEVYTDLARIEGNMLRAGASESMIRETFAAELTPGHPEYDKRLDVVASRVGRTTAVAAFNAGDQAGFETLSEQGAYTKRWLSSHDSRVRPTHVEADTDPANRQVPIDGFFHVGGFSAQFPGDPSLPPQEATNCRCTALWSRPDGTIVASVTTQGAAVTTPETTLPDGWRGPIAALDVDTSDRRHLATPAGGIKTRAYPLTLTANHVGDSTGYPTVGSVDAVWMQDGLLYGEGRFDLGGEHGQNAARQLAEGFLNRVSIDPVEVTAEQRAFSADGTRLELAEGDEMPEDSYTVTVFTDWTLAGLAMVPIPAYTQAAIEPVYGYEPSQNVPDPAVVAAVGGQIFHKAFFGDPKFTKPTPLTIDENGHVYGHVREHGTCYQYGNGAGDGGFCLEPPDSACGYAKFELHGAKMDDGSIARVGALTFGSGHESRGSLKASVKHYNDVATMAAKVNAGTDEFGVWINGEVLDEYADKAYDLLLSPLSGHWEPDADNGGHLEMIAAHVVVTPGYSVRRIVAGFDDAGQPNSLILTNYPAEIVAASVEETGGPALVRPRGVLLGAMNELKRAQELVARIEAGTYNAAARQAEAEEAIVAAAGGASIASTSTPWNGPAAAASILSRATKDGKIDVGMASQGFLAHVGDGSKRGDWKLPFARVSNGAVQIVPRGVAAAAGRLAQTDGIDKGAVGSKICGLYSRIRKIDANWPDCPIGN